MAIFDFNLTQYFEGYRYIAVMAKYLRTKDRQTRVKVASELNIPITTYRRLEEDKNFKNEVIIKKVANHFNLELNVDYEFISKINDDFNEFYNSTYFGDIEYQEKMYAKLMLNFDACQNSLLLIPMNLAKIVYYISNARLVKNFGELKSVIDLLDYFYDDMSLPHKIIYNSYKIGYHAFYYNRLAVEDLAFKTLKLAEGNEFLKTVINYQMSLAYYICKDWSTSLYYAMKAIDGLVYTNNFNRLLYLKFSMAQIFYQLQNYLEALDILEKLIVWTSFNNVRRLEFNSILLSSYCLTRLQRYNEAMDSLLKLSIIDHHREELVVFMLYLCYKLNDELGFEGQWHIIENMEKNNEAFRGYYDLATLILHLKNNEPNSVLKKVYKAIEENFKSLSFCNLLYIIKEEYEARIL